MDFFKNLIADTLALLPGEPSSTYPYTPEKAWPDAGRNEVILQRDSAYELKGVGFNLVTSDPVENGIAVYGSELRDIVRSEHFARICLIGIRDEADEQKAYDLIRKIEYVKYHCFPKGYMMRTSSQSHKEAVRLSKSALQGGISFERVGDLYLNAYLKNPAVTGVKILFVTDEACDCRRFEKIAAKNHAVTETLNHVMNSVSFDCSTCNLKPICDEVEGMRELHLKNAGM